MAEHINEMQNITEKFLPIFQELASVTPGLNVSIGRVRKPLTTILEPVFRRLDSAIQRIAIFPSFLKQVVNRSDSNQTLLF